MIELSVPIDTIPEPNDDQKFQELLSDSRELSAAVLDFNLERLEKSLL